MRGRARPGQRPPSEAVDEGSRRRRRACPDRRAGADRRGRPADRDARRRARGRHLLCRQQPTASRPRDRPRDQGDPGRGPAEQATPTRARADAAGETGLIRRWWSHVPPAPTCRHHLPDAQAVGFRHRRAGRPD